MLLRGEPNESTSDGVLEIAMGAGIAVDVVDCDVMVVVVVVGRRGREAPIRD